MIVGGVWSVYRDLSLAWWGWSETNRWMPLPTGQARARCVRDIQRASSVVVMGYLAYAWGRGGRDTNRGLIGLSARNEQSFYSRSSYGTVLRNVWQSCVGSCTAIEIVVSVDGVAHWNYSVNKASDPRQSLEEACPAVFQTDLAGRGPRGRWNQGTTARSESPCPA